MKSELAILRDEWFESDEGRKCSDPDTLGMYTRQEFLHNRLEAAFLAGAEAGEKCKQHLCDELTSNKFTS